MNVDYLACRIMREFGWTIEYTMRLTYPVFMELTRQIGAVRADAAIDEFVEPYAGVKSGRLTELYAARGRWFTDDNPMTSRYASPSPAALAAAERRMAALTGT